MFVSTPYVLVFVPTDKAIPFLNNLTLICVFNCLLTLLLVKEEKHVSQEV